MAMALCSCGSDAPDPPADRRHAASSLSYLRDVQNEVPARFYIRRDGLDMWAQNRGGLTATFLDDGVEVSPDPAGASSVVLRWTGFGRQGASGGRELGAVALPAAPTARDNEVRYRHGASLEQWWKNGLAGVEQGFDIGARPAGDGWLVLEVSVDGLEALKSDSFDEIELVDSSGETQLYYRALHVQDADGNLLDGHMEAPDGDTIALVIDDRNARYPIVIDPTLTEDQVLAPPVSGQSFGHDVAISDNWMVVGMPCYDPVGSTSNCYGAALFYEFSGGAWVHRDTQTPYAEEAWLGVRVAIHGDRAVVGAPRLAGTVTDEGAAVVYERSGLTWPAATTLTPPGTADPDGNLLLFGVDVAVDGDTVMVGAIREQTASGGVDQPGRVYVFDAGNSYNLVQELAPTTWNGINNFYGAQIGIAGGARDRHPEQSRERRCTKLPV